MLLDMKEDKTAIEYAKYSPKLKLNWKNTVMRENVFITNFLIKFLLAILGLSDAHSFRIKGYYNPKLRILNFGKIIIHNFQNISTNNQYYFLEMSSC